VEETFTVKLVTLPTSSVLYTDTMELSAKVDSVATLNRYFAAPVAVVHLAVKPVAVIDSASAAVGVAGMVSTDCVADDGEAPALLDALTIY
jgi:hypothetical protein